jgi:aryl-alcohol dehydrogenase-like predicted oxidoreductase
MNGTLARRRFLQWLAALTVTGHASQSVHGAVGSAILRPIPSSGEKLSVIGMGTWLTFDVAADWWLREQRCEVLQTFLELGGGLVDSSPMYGRSEEVLGACLPQMKYRERLFAATKVWIYGQRLGID